MAYFGGGGQNGGTGRGGNGANPQTLLQGTQLFVNPNQIQFQGGGNQNYSYSQGDNSQQNQLQLNTGGTPLLLQPPVNFVTDQIGLGQLISQAAVTQNQQNLQNMMNLGNVMNPSLQMSESGSSGSTPKQRVFTGTVTKIHDNFGFIDEEVFFSMQVVKGPVLPKEGDRVLVEADFNPTMPFKWTSTRVQIVNMAGGASHASQGSPGGYPYNSSISGVNKSLAPPPPSISGRPQPVAIVSNPHSVYSSRPSMTETMPSRRVIPLSSTDSSIMSTGVTSMSSMGGGGGGGGMMGAMNDIGHRPMSGGISDNLRMSDRDRDMQRNKDKDRLPNRDLAPRDRERSKERQNKDRDRRERSRERDSARRRTRSRSRDRRSKRDSPARKRSRERDRGRDHRSGASVERSPKVPADPRSRRSRSRETIKSSDGRSVRSSVSPHRKGAKAKPSQPTVKAPRYAVQAPQFSLDMVELNGVEIKRRYPNLYTPSDFFLAKATWMQAFPLHEPYTIGNSSIVHIFGRHVQQLEVPDPQGLNTKFKQVPAILPAPDASCTFTVKVMLLSCAALPAILKKCGCTNEEVVDEKENNQSLTRLLQFAVGVKSGVHEVIALGGSWSPSLDGLNPQSDPKVLVNTAMRCVKAQAGIDLSRVTKWYRFMELYYRRNNGNLETVVYFLPDTNPSTIPGQTEWDTIRSTYRLALYGKEVAAAVSTTVKCEGDAETAVDGEEASKSDGDQTSQESQGQPATGTTDGEGAVEDTAEKVGEKEQLDEILQMEVVDECNGDEAPEVVSEDVANPPVSKMDTSFDIYDGIVEVDKASAPVITGEPEKLKLPSLSIDPKSMTVVKLREELNHRNLNTKGLKQELVARLTQALKDDEEDTEDDKEVAKDESKVSETPAEPEPAVPAESSTPIKMEPEELNESSPKIKIVDPCSIMEASIEGEESVKENAEVEQHDDSNDEFPIIKESMSAEEKKVWERRYSVPKTPKLLVYPSKGDPSRDCTLMSLSTLRDYRASDKKEESFEVSLFSEFFFEMLQRDFAFKIYRELRKEYRKSTPDKVKVEEEEEKKEKDESSEPAAKRRKTSTTDAGSSSEKMKVVDPLLLLAFSFFDTTRCGYIMEVDLEEICGAIGIGITKRTIRKMAQKVVSKGSLHYRKLTDKPETEGAEVSNEDAESIKRLAMGNKVMLPVFSFSEAEVVIDDSVKADGDLAINGEEAPPINAVIDGQVVDVRQMKDKLEKAEKGMSSAEASVNVLKNSLNEAKNHVSELQKSNDSLKEKLSKTKETLKKVESSDKAAKDDLEVFKRASERFVDRIKGLVKLPSNSKDSSKESSKEKSTGTSSKTKEESSSDKKPAIPVEVSGNNDPPNNVIATEK